MSRSWLTTLRALLRPRRAVPILAVVVALVAAERLAGFGWRGAAVSALLSAVFIAFAPGWWCWLFRPSAPSSRAAEAWRLLLYLAGCVTLVVGVGWLAPPLLQARSSVLLDAAGWPVLIVLFVVGGWGLGRDIQLEASLQAAEARGARLAREVAQARLMAVQRQLDPHFLFNTLNAIAEWCAQDPQVAEQATLQLANMLRSMLTALECERWPLADELALIEQLFELHRIRDPETLSYSIKGDRQAPVAVPALLLLPLAENAMTHGPRAGHHGHVSVVVKCTDRLIVRIHNPGPYAGRRSSGRGIDGVRQRLRLAYGGDARLEVGTAPESDPHTIAEVTLPRSEHVD